MHAEQKDMPQDQYKDTVFLPKTDFPMRGELPKKEPGLLKKWQEMDLYGQLRKQSEGREKFILHDGPPYANGHIHAGTALTKILKDIVNRTRQMTGFDAPWVPGWDCHGLPIEWKVEEQYRAEGKNKDEVDPVTFRAECRAFADKWVHIQSEEFQRLGSIADWENPYLTMTHDAEATILKELYKFLDNGLLYRGAKPVMWSTVEKTALAEAEVEYKEHKSVCVWVKFPVVSSPVEALQSASVVIWTTTPWTLPSNRAIAFGEDIEYGVFDTGEEKLILALSLAEEVREKAGFEAWTQVATFKGADLTGTVCAHPLRGQGYDEDRPLLPGDFVTDDAGTGFVHIAPGHGEDDFWLGQKHGLEITDNVSDDGIFRDHVPLFAGQEVYTDKGELGGGNFAVIKAINEAGALLAKGNLKHDYPHSWRSKAPVIFRTTPQWFIRMDGDGDLRGKALKAIADTRWVPAKGETRIRSMVENRPDWCISRQRAWGVPIALFVHKETGEVLKDQSVLDRIASAFEENGADAWWTMNAQDFLGDAYKAEDYEQVFDVVDVWFESGATHAFVVENTEKWPVFEGVTQSDVYCEGSDQHRGWFQSSLMESCGTRGQAPYKTVITNGYVLDEKGYKMSKSLGNVTAPAEVWDTHGADILRLWVVTSDYTEDISIGPNILKSNADLYRRLRNTLRFLLGALDGFTREEMVTDTTAMPELERLVLHHIAEMDTAIRNDIENYAFGKMAQRLHHFCNTDLSAFYFDIRKDSLYCDAPGDPKRRACRTVLYHLFDCLVTWLAPVLCFTAEEAWSHRPPGVLEEVESVHLRVFPDVPKNWKDEKLAEKWAVIRNSRSEALGAIETLRANKEIGSSLEVEVQVPADPDDHLESLGPDLADVFIVSKAEAVPNIEKVLIRPATSKKCARCWKVLPEVGENTDHPHLCGRCAGVVSGL